jgi:hypothetical protein
MMRTASLIVTGLFLVAAVAAGVLLFGLLFERYVAENDP